MEKKLWVGVVVYKHAMLMMKLALRQSLMVNH